MSTLASVIEYGLFSALPSAGIPGRLYFCSDSSGSHQGEVLRDNGTSFDIAGYLGPSAGGGSGFANPMTTEGDLIYGGSSGTATRLAAGTSGYLLSSQGTGGPPLWVPAGLSNPMTTLGDVIVGASSGTPARLAVGTNGQVLTANSSATDGVDWETPSGGSGGLTQIAQQILGSPAATITFSSIPGSYTNLMLVLIGKSSAGVANDAVQMQFNGDTSSDYTSQYLYATGSGTFAGVISPATSIQIGAVMGTSGGTAIPGVVQLMIPGYSSSTFSKYAQTQASFQTNSGVNGPGLQFFSVLWDQTAAIASIALFLNSGGNFTVGSQFTLYGLQ